MDVGIVVEHLRNCCQSSFDLVIARGRRGKRYDADRGSKFVVDPMIELLQQNLFVRQGPRSSEFHQMSS